MHLEVWTNTFCNLANGKESGSELGSEITLAEGNGFWTSERIICINEYLLNKQETIYIHCCDDSFLQPFSNQFHIGSSSDILRSIVLEWPSQKCIGFG